MNFLLNYYKSKRNLAKFFSSPIPITIETASYSVD
jgi:hypothetical protein